MESRSEAIPEVGVHDDGYGAVVDEGDLHVGAEFAGLDFFAEEVLQFGDELLVHGDGEVGPRGVDVAGAVALLGGGHEGELAHHEDAAASNVGDRQIHHPFAVVEYAQLHHLLAEVFYILVGVLVADAHENHHSLADGRLLFSVDTDGRLSYTLKNYSHFFYVNVRKLVRELSLIFNPQTTCFYLIGSKDSFLQCMRNVLPPIYLLRN